MPITKPSKIPSRLAAGPSGCRLVVDRGPDEGHTCQAFDHAVIGREDASLLLEDAEVSRRHAEIVWADGCYIVRDLNSRNGTFVNELRVNQSRVLAPGDRIRVGNSTIAFHLHDPIAQEAAHRQRLETLGRMTAGIAHDFNNILSVVLANLGHARDLLEEEGVLQPDVQDCFDDVQTAVDRAASMTPRLLTCARNDGDARRVNVSAMCHEIRSLIRRTFPRAITVVADVEDNAVIVADEIGLHQIVMNLCVNARDAMPDGGSLTFAVRTVKPGQVPGFAGRRTVQVVVEDSGHGMDAATRERIFEPFFSTKGAAGHGIGLAVTRSMVEEFGGRIEVESEVGQGTCFRLTFPAALPQPRTNAGTTQRETLARSPQRALSGRVLIVDDEALLRKIARRVFERMGMDVTEATNGAEAVRQYASLESTPDLVLLDLDMPEMGGEQTLRILRGMDAEARVLILTGHRDESRGKRLLAAGATMVLRKPVHPNRLTDIVRQLLGMRGAAPVPRPGGQRS